MKIITIDRKLRDKNIVYIYRNIFLKKIPKDLQGKEHSSNAIEFTHIHTIFMYAPVQFLRL